MCFTPLAGVKMATRSGDVNPAINRYIMEKTHKSAPEVIKVFNKMNDVRDILAEVETNDRDQLALDIFADRIHRYIGSYAARMSGVDAVVFTAGVGENSKIVRSQILTGLEFMGIYWDPVKNETCGR